VRARQLCRAEDLTVRIPSDVARKIGHYVYLYVDPRTRRPFYVGKGKGSRALVHLGATKQSRKLTLLRHLRRAHRSPQIDVLAHGLPDEETAFRIEAAVIDALGASRLTNEVRGWGSVEFGRMPLRRLIAYYRAKPARVRHPVLLVRINRLYDPDMRDDALYEATRGVWRLNPARAAGAKYALATFQGIVLEVYQIERWHPAGSTKYRTRPRKDVRRVGRWEFVGRLAPDAIRRRYVDHSVRHYLRRGLQSPVVYVGC
jgi:uncharacterized protein